MTRKYIEPVTAGVYYDNGWSKPMGVENAMLDGIVLQPIENRDLFCADGMCKTPEVFVKCGIRRPLNHFTIGSLTDSLLFSYNPDCSLVHMTSYSLVRIKHTLWAYHLDRVEYFNVSQGDRKFALRVFHPFSTKLFNWYVEKLLDIRHLNFSERSSGLESLTEMPKSIDLWWDVENDVILTFDKNYASHLNDMLKRSNP